MKERIFAIGDVHGHYSELVELTLTLAREAGFDPQIDHLVLLGDLVDAGSDVSQVLEWAIKYKASYPNTFHPLKGNHEDLMLDALSEKHPIYGDYYIWWNQGGRETLKSYTDQMNVTDYEKAIMQPLDYIPSSHLQFLQSLPLYWQTDEYFFCHAGLKPGKKIDEIAFNSLEVQKDLLWIREEFYMSDFDWGKKIVFGHTGFQEYTQNGTEFAVNNKNNLLGINTMPRNQGYLTAVELPTEKFYRQSRVL